MPPPVPGKFWGVPEVHERAVLPLTVLLTSVRKPPSASLPIVMPPPLPLPELLLIVLETTIAVPSSERPPPRQPAALLPSTVLPASVSTPVLRIPPPPDAAVLLRTTLSMSWSDEPLPRTATPP